MALTFSIARLTGGLYFGVRSLCQTLLNENVTSDVITLEGGWGERLTQEEIESWKPLNITIFPCQRPRKFGYSSSILPALEKKQPHIVHCHGMWHYHILAASKYCSVKKIPWLVSAHGMLDSWALNNKGWKKRLASWLYHDAAVKNASCIRALCNAEADSIRRSGFQNPISVIPNGVELPAEGAAPGRRSREDGRKTLLFLGRIHPKKGLVNLIKAWANHRKSGIENRKSEEWVLAIAGMDEGGHEAEIRRLVLDLALEESVFFLGPQYGSAKALVLESANAFILPSYSEGLPMGVLDAWAYRLPVLMTPECNLPEGFAANAALRIEQTAVGRGRRAEGIERGLLELFQAPEPVLRSLGENGRALVASRFSWPKIGQDMRAVYDWLLGGSPKPDGVQIV